MLRKVFTACIRTELEYSTPVWSSYWKRHIDLVEKVQRWITKIVTEVRELPILEGRRKRGDMIMTCKFFNGCK